MHDLESTSKKYLCMKPSQDPDCGFREHASTKDPCIDHRRGHIPPLRYLSLAFVSLLCPPHFGVPSCVLCYFNLYTNHLFK
uniref:Uncharacterized protein n=1 Tax=Romanomermis culicivorax TaxID=13658 RepID=A0A915JPL3_ROMCU